MKVISTGYNIYNIIPGTSLESYDKIPASVYRIGFDPMKGFNLIKQDNFKVEEKIYGEHEKNIHIIIEGFKHSNRSMGVIFSGDKGLGKSLVARKLCVNMIKDEIIPVIIIDKYIDGIVEFIESIDQNVVLFFDEFDKMFSNRSCNDDDDDWGHTRRTTSEQDRLLSLFDGTSSGKKLFILTCNNIYDISKYLINRTGRVHYHVRFEYPTDTEVKQYLEDNLINKDNALITKVSSFALITNLTFDSLHSICFELNLGRDFDDIIDILNIINYDSDWFKVDCLLSDGRRYLFDQVIDLFDYKNGGKCILDLTPEVNHYRSSPAGELIINLKDLVFQKSSRSWILKNPQKAKVVMYSRDEDNLICESLTIKRAEKSTYKFNF